jgi:hypothetical protein
MAARNKELRQALEKLSSSDVDTINALNAILNANDSKEFRGAIINSADFWRKNNFNVPDGTQDSDMNFLNWEGVVGPGGKKVNDFAELYGIAAEQRLKLQFKNVVAEVLIPLIKKDSKEESLKQFSKFSKDNFPNELNLKIVEELNNMADLQIENIRSEAKSQFLLKKIAACNDPKKIDQLLSSRNDDQFQKAVNDLIGGNQGLVSHMSHSLLNGAVEKEGKRKKDIAFSVRNLEKGLFGQHAVALLQESNEDEFLKKFKPLVFDEDIFKTDMIYIKQLLAARFLKDKAAELPIDSLLGVINSNDPNDVQNNLNKLIPFSLSNDTLPQELLPEIRDAFATQALLSKIMECDDDSVLGIFSAAKDSEQIEKGLIKLELGINHNDVNVKKAFNDALNLINTAAQIRKNLSAVDDLDALKALVVSNAQDFATTYLAKFAPNATNQTKNAIINNYFSSNHKQVRKQVLFACVKKALAQDKLNFTDNNAKEAVKTFFPGASSHIHDLLEDKSVLDKLNNYAKAELGVRKQIAELDFNQLKNKINSYGVPEGLTPKESQALQARLIEGLLNHPEVTIDNASKIATAKNLPEFRKVLKQELNLDDLPDDWDNNDKLRGSIQKAACLKGIKEKISEVSCFDAQAHPNLVALISNLPPEKQKALLDDKNKSALRVLARPQKTKDPKEIEKIQEEIKRIIGDNSIDVNDLIEENKQLSLKAKIQNAEIAKILANVPSISLDEGKLNEINRFLGGRRDNSLPPPPPPPPPVNFDNNDNYQKSVVHILKITGVLELADAHKAFGIEKNSDQFTIKDSNFVNGVRGKIENQQNYNQFLFSMLKPPAPDQAAVINLCLTLPKNNRFTAPAPAPAPAPHQSNHFDNFVKDLNTSDSLKDFLDKAKGKENDINEAYPAEVCKYWTKHLTPEAFKEVKRELVKQQLSDGDDNKFNEALTQQGERIKKVRDLFNKVKQEDTAPPGKGALMRLAKVAEFDKDEENSWLNLGFQATALHDANKMSIYYKELADNYNKIVAQYKYQKDFLLEELDRLPKNEAQQQQQLDKWQEQIEERRDELNDLLTKVQRGLSNYESMLKLLNGDPELRNNTDPKNDLRRKGILKTLEEFKGGKKDIQINNDDKKILPDQPLSDQQNYIANIKRPPGSAGANTPTSVQSNDEGPYKIVNAVPKGYFRVTEFTHKELKDNNNNAPIRSHHMEESDRDKNLVKLTAINPPPHPSELSTNISDEDRRKYITANVNYYLDMAAEYLCKFGPPTPEKPAILQGSSEEEMRYLWTAFMALAQKGPMKFNHTALRVPSSSSFIPSNEIGLFGLRSDSLYEQEFKKLAALDNAVHVLEGITNDKKKYHNMQKDVKSRNSLFKGNLKTIKKEVEDANEAAELGNEIAVPTSP